MFETSGVKDDRCIPSVTLLTQYTVETIVRIGAMDNSFRTL